jgi:hypothetical protein
VSSGVVIERLLSLLLQEPWSARSSGPQFRSHLILRGPSQLRNRLAGFDATRGFSEWRLPVRVSAIFYIHGGIPGSARAGRPKKLPR